MFQEIFHLKQRLVAFLRHSAERGIHKQKEGDIHTDIPSAKTGGDLLSHGRSTIGASGLNFSVRNGKRWDPAA